MEVVFGVCTNKNNSIQAYSKHGTQQAWKQQATDIPREVQNDERQWSGIETEIKMHYTLHSLRITSIEFEWNRKNSSVMPSVSIKWTLMLERLIEMRDKNSTCSIL